MRHDNKIRNFLRIGIVQTKVPFSVKEGQSCILKFIRQAKDRNVDLLGLPEDCVCGLFKYLKDYDPLEFLSRAAKAYSINLFGANATLEQGRYYGTGFYINREGELTSKVHKIILTKPEKNAGFNSGDEIQIFDTEFGKMAVLVCKDAFNRYAPFWFYDLKRKGVEYILVPSMSLKFDDNSIKFWLQSMWLLGRWFDVYIFAPGTVSKNYTSYPSFGNSVIVERDKGFLKQGSEDKEELLVAEIAVRSKEEIEKDYGLKWDTVLMPQIKIVVKS